jgi:DNA-binding response OmpR family regulator
MKPIRILIISPETSLRPFLEDKLPDSMFRVFQSSPGPALMDFFHQAEIAVIDYIDERPETVQLEVALLKKWKSKIPIIVISRNSSEQDVRVVEQGIFYYLTGQPEQKLTRVIHAAADAISRDSQNYRKT